jgi:hypothetical protein
MPDGFLARVEEMRMRASPKVTATLPLVAIYIALTPRKYQEAHLIISLSEEMRTV